MGRTTKGKEKEKRSSWEKAAYPNLGRSNKPKGRQNPLQGNNARAYE